MAVTPPVATARFNRPGYKRPRHGASVGLVRVQIYPREVDAVLPFDRRYVRHLSWSREHVSTAL